MTGPRRIHYVLPDQAGRDMMETLCNVLIIPIRDDKDMITHFTTRAGHTIQTMFDRRGVTCNTCQHIARSAKCP